MSLYQLMGAPLRALVEAETNAAFATARFIREVGFTEKKTDGAGEGDLEDFGDLRMVTFKHERINANGEKKTYKVEWGDSVLNNARMSGRKRRTKS